MSVLILIAALSYLLGSIPFGYLLVRIFRDEDVRQSGSGNIGATNVSRKSPALGIMTLLLDALKGTAAVVMASHLAGGTIAAGKPYAAMSMAALLAVLGHMFPLWLKFRGGKGVATGLGSFVVITPKAVLVAACIFFVVVALFRYVSLASIVAVASLPLLLLPGMAVHGHPTVVAWILMTATCLLIVIRHHENVRRLLAGTENRIGAKRA
jgi:glycerol-3-phosphate acyltransferase PlsY